VGGDADQLRLVPEHTAGVTGSWLRQLTGFIAHWQIFVADTNC